MTSSRSEAAPDSEEGVLLHFDDYSYLVPAAMEWARPMFQLASEYLDLYDQVTNRWRSSAGPASRTDANGLLLGLGDRSREAMRSSQLLTGHGLYRDAVQVVRPMVEATIYAGYIYGDGAAEAAARAATFTAFQAVERKRNLEAIRGSGRLDDMQADIRSEIEREYTGVEASYDGKIFSKSAFDCTFRELAERADMLWLYRTAYNHASAFSHLTVGSLVSLPSSLHDLGLGIAVATFPVVFRIMNGHLGLGADPHLKDLELRTNAICTQTSP